MVNLGVSFARGAVAGCWLMVGACNNDSGRGSAEPYPRMRVDGETSTSAGASARDLVAVDFVGVAPIAVGHEVEVRTYLRNDVPSYDEPVVIDLTTGVVYGEAWYFEEFSSFTVNQPRRGLPLEPRRDLREHARLRGKVAASRVAWIGDKNQGTRFPQTSLLIRVAADAGSDRG